MYHLRVKAIRTNMNLDQEEFAKLIDMPLSTFRTKEQGKSDWLYKEVIKIAEVTNTKLSDISPD